MIKILTLFLFLVSCGSESGSNSENNETETKEKSVVTSSPDIESISLDAKSDLPECSDDNRSQLAYVLEEDNFYVCQKAWKLISIKGKQGDKGEKGDSGVTTTVHVDGGNSSNIWVDSMTGLTWYLGGSNTHAQAVLSCTGSYRLPTIAEAHLAITHGIRLIATDIGANLDFWTSEKVFASDASYYYASLTSGSPSSVPAGPAAGYSVFCVK